MPFERKLFLGCGRVQIRGHVSDQRACIIKFKKYIHKLYLIQASENCVHHKHIQNIIKEIKQFYSKSTLILITIIIKLRRFNVEQVGRDS
jgi:hypothetical protein